MTSDQPQEGAPRRPVMEFEDNHYHDDDDVVVEAPVDDAPRPPVPPAGRARPSRRLPPRPRRFDED